MAEDPEKNFQTIMESSSTLLGWLRVVCPSLEDGWMGSAPFWCLALMLIVSRGLLEYICARPPPIIVLARCASCAGDAFVMSLIGVMMPTLSLLYLMMPCILQVVDAVNRERRGWVNVEMDVIACEACGARILFSIPSSSTQQQGQFW